MGSQSQCVLMSVLWLCWSGVSFAHDADNLLITFEKTGESWQANIEMDVVLAIPEMRNNNDEPQPTRQWLVDRSDAEHEKLREGAEDFMRESISFTYQGEPVSYELSFPDYEGPSPNFPSLLNGGAYMSLRMVGELGASERASEPNPDCCLLSSIRQGLGSGAQRRNSR